MHALYVPLPAKIAEILLRLALSEMRHPRQEAVVLIVEGLRKRKLLTDEGESAELREENRTERRPMRKKNEARPGRFASEEPGRGDTSAVVSGQQNSITARKTPILVIRRTYSPDAADRCAEALVRLLSQRGGVIAGSNPDLPADPSAVVEEKEGETCLD